MFDLKSSFLLLEKFQKNNYVQGWVIIWDIWIRFVLRYKPNFFPTNSNIHEFHFVVEFYSGWGARNLDLKGSSLPGLVFQWKTKQITRVKFAQLYLNCVLFLLEEGEKNKEFTQCSFPVSSTKCFLPDVTIGELYCLNWQAMICNSWRFWEYPSKKGINYINMCKNRDKKW